MEVFGLGLDGVVGIGAGLATSASMIPQVVKIVKEKKASQVSVVMILILTTGVSLWIWYGVIKDDKPIIYTNSFSLLVNLLMGYLRFKYRNNKEP